MRADGKRVDNIDPMYKLAPYFMRERNDATNSITVKLPYDAVHQYKIDLRKRGHDVSHMAIILAAYVRVICEYPQMNRFIINSKFYAHNDFTIGMVVLRPDGADPSMDKMTIDLDSNIFEVNDIINTFVEKNNKADSENNGDKAFKMILRFPGLVRIGMGALRWADKHGLLPGAIIRLSPFHNSLVFTNLASIRTNEIYHHIYNFGSTGVVIAMGNTTTEAVLEKGQIVMKKFIPLGITMDERIACGSSFARAFERLQHLLKHPEELEQHPEEIKVDFPFETLSRRFKK